MTGDEQNFNIIKKRFDDIVGVCKTKYQNISDKKFGKSEFAFCWFQTSSIHYELSLNSLSSISIEFHLENFNKDYKKKKDKIKLLKTALKDLEGIQIFDKKIIYDPEWYGLGRIYILLDFSMRTEKIICYEPVLKSV